MVVFTGRDLSPEEDARLPHAGAVSTGPPAVRHAAEKLYLTRCIAAVKSFEKPLAGTREADS